MNKVIIFISILFQLIFKFIYFTHLKHYNQLFPSIIHI